MPDSTPFPTKGAENDLALALSACKGSFFYAGFFSLFINVLLLVPAIYMLAVYDRVLTSSSESTLLMLTLIVVFLFLALGGLEWIRSQILVAIGTRLDQLLGGRVFDVVFAQALASAGRNANSQPLGDLLQLRQFLTGSGLFAFFDAPWLPIYVALLFCFHWGVGLLGSISALLLAALAVWNELATRSSLHQANQENIEANQFAQRNLRNAEAIEAMGMLPQLRERWRVRQDNMVQLQKEASNIGGLIAALSKTYRITVQSLVLGLGAYLAIHKEITPGLVISGSILLGRALAPLDLMVGSWRGFVQTREAYQRLQQMLSAFPAREPPMPLPPPQGNVVLENLVIIPAGRSEPILKDISLSIASGTLVAVIGPSAAGKSTLARAILGVYRPAKGHVRIDGADIGQWDRAKLGPYLGYLPQDVELLDGTVSENIARFGTIDPHAVVRAAQLAGVHEMVLRLPEGYETRLFSGGAVLSAGQQQRIGIARALYGNPPLVVLDEPNANLDMDGDIALAATLAELKKHGQTVVVVTHRANILHQVDKILALAEGRVALYGLRDEVLAVLAKPQKNPSLPAATAAS